MNDRADRQPINPVTRMDYPDPDVIRVDDVYYMVSTTMYFMPGCEILRSYDLVHWEHAAYVYERLDSTPAQRMKDGSNIYGCGMWAASLRYHEGIFYICFVANDTHRTYLYRSAEITGPWEKSEISGFYHDNSILFDDDGRVYIVYGNREIHLTELSPDLCGPRPGGIDRIILTDAAEAPLGYEGAHFYRINGRYYLFLIHIPAGGRRTEACFSADSLTGEFTGGDVMDDDRGYHNMGVAQGGIVDTTDGRWYAMLFQDSGAVGRIPILMPVTWENGLPVFGDHGHIPESFPTPAGRADCSYMPLTGSDDFRDARPGDTKAAYDSFGFRSFWQFSHEPDLSLIRRDPTAGTFTITSGRLSGNLVQASNTLTQRTIWPGCTASVTLCGADLKQGDYAGLCLLESAYAFIALTRRSDGLYLVMGRRIIDTPSIWGIRDDREAAEECAAEKISCDTVTLRASADFTDMKDEGRFYFASSDVPEWKSFGPAVQLRFRLDHFTGVRFGLFLFSTEQAGGSAVFSDFRYESSNR